MKLILFWLIVINLLSFFLFGRDKTLAKKRKRRIPERILWTVSLFGGGTGAFLGMHIFRHKTKHLSFVLGVPACALLNWLSVYLCCLYL